MPEIPRPDPRWRPDLSAVAAVAAVVGRSRWPRVILTVVLAAMLGRIVDQARDDAASARAAWGPTDPVWVATDDVDAGEVITAADVALRRLPEAALPRDPVRDSPVGMRLFAPVTAGEVLRDGRLADPDTGRLTALLPPGTGGIRLPTGADQLSPGDVVDLYALLTGTRVAAGAEVIAVDDGMATVAVTVAEIPDVVRSFTTGDVVPVIVP